MNYVVMSEPPPAEAINEAAMASGVGQFLPLLQGDPPSPPVRLKVTQTAIWAFNADGSLYERIGWGEINTATFSEEGWHLTPCSGRIACFFGLIVRSDDDEAWERAMRRPGVVLANTSDWEGKKRRGWERTGGRCVRCGADMPFDTMPGVESAAFPYPADGCAYSDRAASFCLEERRGYRALMEWRIATKRLVHPEWQSFADEYE
ncbi:MAG: hypothetical protein GEU78_16195 [Actinobacteria bacterium]|nr:hypothetical protein [Actinomycetota bacterium]